MGVLLGGSRRRCNRRRVRKIAVEKFFEENRAGTDLAFSEAVVGDEEADVGVGDQMQVAMKINGIAAVADDAMAVASFFVKTKGHAVQARV